MKTALITTLLFLSFSTVFCQDTTYFNSNWEVVKKRQASFYNVTEKRDKLWITRDYFISGKIQMEGAYSSLAMETKEGAFTYYFENGQKEGVGNYEKGLKEGTYTWYFDNGNVDSKEFFVKGKLNEKYTAYHKNGNVSYVVNYKNDILEGNAIYYYEGGEKSHSGVFKGNKKSGKWEYFSEEGELVGTELHQQKFKLPEAKLEVEFPNDSWFMAEQSSMSGILLYNFKRTPIENKEGIPVIPNISFVIEDVAKDTDVILYSTQKRLKVPFTVETVFTHEDKTLKLKNAIGYTGTTTYSDGNEHSVYIIHAINNGKGIQIIMDITSNLFEEYETEFIEVVKSIKVVK